MIFFTNYIFLIIKIDILTGLQYVVFPEVGLLRSYLHQNKKLGRRCEDLS